MAQLVSIGITYRGLDEFRQSLATISEAADVAGMDDLQLTMVGHALTFEGMDIVTVTAAPVSGGVTCIVKPTPSMVLYIGWLMTKLPSYATVTWADGWPSIYCPPRDDRDHEDEPAPQVPGQCVPA